MRPSTARPVVAGMLLLVAACTGAPGGPGASPVETGAPPASLTAPPPAATSSPGAPVQSTPAAATGSPGAPAATGAATPATVPAAPPTALLGSAGTEVVAGELGSYTWRQGGSDAPWIIVPARNAVRLPSPYRVDLEPGPEPLSWIVVWAPIERGLPGAIAGDAQGSGGAIRFSGPAGRGPWSLRLEADFGSLGRATWYWRLVPGS